MHTTCVVLVSSQQPAPTALLEGLRRRGAKVSVHFDAPSAMVALHRGQALVVVDPPTAPRGRVLVGAVKQHLPHVACWEYVPPAGGGKGTLMPWGQGGSKRPTAQSPEPVHAEPPRPAVPAPQARAAAQPPESSKMEPMEPMEPVMITPEELAMLVSPLETEDRGD